MAVRADGPAAVEYDIYGTGYTGSFEVEGLGFSYEGKEFFVDDQVPSGIFRFSKIEALVAGNLAGTGYKTLAAGSYSYTGEIPQSNSPSHIPEPSTILLLATGLGGLVWLRKKFKS